MVRKKFINLLLSLLTALPFSAGAENIPSAPASQPQSPARSNDKRTTAPNTKKQIKYDDKLTLSMGYGLNLRQSDAELQNHYFPFSAGYKLNNNIRLSVNGAANLVRRKETDENGNVSRSGFEGVSIGPQIDLNYKRLKLSLAGEFTDKNPLVFETSNEKVSSVSAELEGTAKLKKDLAVIAGLSGLTTDEEINATMLKFYWGVNKRINKTASVYTAIVNTRDSNIYNNNVTYGVIGFSEKDDSSTLNLQGYGGQKLGGKLELENVLRPDISLRLGLEGSLLNDVKKVREFNAYISLVFH